MASVTWRPPQCSTILPSAMRQIWRDGMVSRTPLAGMPKKGLLWVAVKVLWYATRSPSATTASGSTTTSVHVPDRNSAFCCSQVPARSAS